MKSFNLSIWSILILFSLVMAGVVATAFFRKSNATGIDPARIKEMREFVKR